MPRPRGEKGKSQTQSEPWRCAWRTEGAQCYLLGEIGDGRYDGDAFYCGWHYWLRRDPEFSSNREEFDRYAAQSREKLSTLGMRMQYCNVWAHHGDQELWMAVRGVAPLGPAVACKREDCKHGPMSRAMLASVEEVPF